MGTSVINDRVWDACVAFASRNTGSNIAATRFAEWVRDCDGWRGGEHVDAAWDRFTRSHTRCPECAGEVWDRAHGHHLHRCWDTEAHEHRGTLAFDEPLGA